MLGCVDAYCPERSVASCSVVAIARRGGIDVLTNEVSKRLTASMVAFSGKERKLGEQALSGVSSRIARMACATSKRLARLIEWSISWLDSELFSHNVMLSKAQLLVAPACLTDYLQPEEHYHRHEGCGRQEIPLRRSST